MVVIKPQKAVIDNTVYIASFTTILSLIMQAVFFFLKKWDYTVLTGNLLGACAAVLNFYVMALFVQSAFRCLHLHPRDADCLLQNRKTE